MRTRCAALVCGLSCGLILALATASGVGAQGVGAQTDSAVQDSAVPPKLPYPSLDGVEPAVAEQLQAARSDLDALVGAAGLLDTTGMPARPELTAEVAESYGQVGRLYHSYLLESAAAVAYAWAEYLQPQRPLWPYLRAVIFLLERQLDDAEAALGRVLERVPGHVGSRLRLANLWYLADRPDEAEKMYRQVLDDPSHSEIRGAAGVAHFGLGRLAAERGELETAIEFLQRALAEQPEAVAVHQHLGLAYRQLGKLDLARDELRQAGRTTPDFDDPWTISLTPSGATARLLIGNQAFRRGDIDTALLHHQAAAEIAPDNPSVLRALALTLERHGQLGKALENYRRVVELDAENPMAHYDWARAGLAAGQPPEIAIAALERALDLAPRYTDARLLLAAQLADAGQLAEAKKSFEVVLANSAGEPRALEGLALVEFRRSLDLPPAAARVALEHAVELDPNLRDAQFNLGVILADLGEYAAAALRLTRVCELDVTDVEARRVLATSWLRLGREQEAAQVLDEALALKPDDVALLTDAAILRATAADAVVTDGRRALELAQRAFGVQRTPSGAEAMAMALAAAGGFEQAIAWQTRLLDQARSLSSLQSMTQRLESNLERYRAGKPARSPWQQGS